MKQYGQLTLPKFDDSATSKEILAATEAVFPAYLEVFIVAFISLVMLMQAVQSHLSSSASSGFWFYMIAVILNKHENFDGGIHASYACNNTWIIDVNGEWIQDFALIYSTCEEVESADVPHALQVLLYSVLVIVFLLNIHRNYHQLLSKIRVPTTLSR